jgi:hypothetical protein
MIRRDRVVVKVRVCTTRLKLGCLPPGIGAASKKGDFGTSRWQLCDQAVDHHKEAPHFVISRR